MPDSTDSPVRGDAADVPALPVIPGLNDPATLRRVGDFWLDQLNLWQRMLDPKQGAAPAEVKDKRFAGNEWSDNPWFDWMRRSYLSLGDHLMRRTA